MVFSSLRGERGVDQIAPKRVGKQSVSEGGFPSGTYDSSRIM